MSPEAALVVEMGAQRQASHSLVNVRCTPMSRDGAADAASAISRNHGPGTITEPQVTSPRAARSRKALFAPWLAPRSSTWGTTARLNGVDLSEWPDDSFDLVATYSVLHHIPDYLAAVGEMGRVCRPGGVVYIDHEHAPDYWTAGPVHHDFRKQALRPDLSKWLRPINYYGKIRRLFDPKFANEGDIHVWPDDHIEWDRIIATLGSSFEPVLDNSFLLYDGRYRPEIYAKYSDSLVDMRVMAFRKR